MELEMQLAVTTMVHRPVKLQPHLHMPYKCTVRFWILVHLRALVFWGVPSGAVIQGAKGLQHMTYTLCDAVCVNIQ